MGYVIKEGRQVYVRTDNVQIVPDDRLEELEKAGLAQPRRKITILVYSETDFQRFFQKHVRREASGEYTVIAKNDTQIPPISEIRILIENALLKGKMNWANETLFQGVPEPFCTRTWNSSSGFVDKSANNGLLFRDLVKITRKNMGVLRTEITKLAYENLRAIWAEVFKKTEFQGQKLGVEYVVATILLFRKILAI